MCSNMLGVCAADEFGSDTAKDICKICATVCKACAEECSRHSTEHCKECVAACNACTDECNMVQILI